jgi:hypothetical protein
MNRIELYKKTVDILLDAYNNGTLEHGHCSRCAVGNICGGSAWSDRFSTTINCDSEAKQYIYNFDYEEIDICIQNSGYSQKELMEIEYAFESSIAHDYTVLRVFESKKGQYIGLCAVMKVLQNIHEVEQSNHKMTVDRLENIYEEKKKGEKKKKSELVEIL